MRVLFVCSGNICRSPMAEVIARASLPEIDFVSAGLAAMPGDAASAGAVAAVAEMGLDLRSHRARPVAAELAPLPDRIYVMTHAQLAALSNLLDEPSGRVQLLDPEGGDIADPYGGSDLDYRLARDEIGAAIAARTSEWITSSRRPPRRDT
jgi:protein-tyrosine-phosphatase